MEYRVKIYGKEHTARMIYRDKKRKAILFRVDGLDNGHDGSGAWANEDFPIKEVVRGAKNCWFIGDEDITELKETINNVNDLNNSMFV